MSVSGLLSASAQIAKAFRLTCDGALHGCVLRGRNVVR